MPPRKTSFHKKYVNALVPCSFGLLQFIERFLQLAYEMLAALSYKPLRLLHKDDHIQFTV